MRPASMKRRAPLRLLLVLALSALAFLAFTRSSRLNASAENLEEGKLLDRTLQAITRSYYDPERIDPRKMLGGALDAMQLKVPEILITGRESDILTVTVGLASKRMRVGSLRNLADLSALLHEVLAFVLTHYEGDGETKPEEIEYATIEGLLEALDPHSNFLSPKVYKEFKVGTQGQFGGLGIVISIKDGFLTVISPIEGTPAFQAGIAAGDRIMQIDDESTINMSLTDAVNKLRGEVGTKVTLVVEAPKRPSRKLTLKRAIINIESVQHSLLTSDAKRIGYIKIKSFQDNTDDDVKTALDDLHKDGAALDGLILDVRNNPGGLLNVAVDVADRFLRQGVIVSTVGPHNQLIDKSSASSFNVEPEYPIVVLVNEGAASASEIVAGALARNDRAIVIGQRTFGKGSVQTLYELGSGAALKLTIAQYLPAGTDAIQLIGITPDIELIPTTVDLEAMNLIKDKVQSELDLEMHLGGKDEKVRHPDKTLPDSRFSVRYLKPKEDEKQLEERSLKEYAKRPDLAGDFPVEFAQTLITSAGDLSRKSMLAKSEQSIHATEEKQQQAMAEALKKLSIDWSSVPAGGEPKLRLAYHLRKGERNINQARAGNDVDLELVATNIGAGPYSQLIGISSSDSRVLSDKEFPFGNLAPGQTKSFRSPLKLPKGMETQDLTMELNFQEEHGNAPEPLTIVVPVVELPPPSFSYAADLPTIPKGGRIPLGRPVTLAVDVINTGKGATSPETTAAISNDCGEKFFIERGRSTIGSLAPGARRRADFRFHISQGFDEKACAVKLAIVDLDHLEVLTKRIELIPDKGALEPERGKTFGPPGIVLSSLPTTTDRENVLLSGQVEDADAVKDLYIFVGERKIAYQSNADGTTTMPFSVTVPLEKGTNRIVIGARDALDLMKKKVVVIERVEARRREKEHSNASTPLPTFIN